MTPFVQFRALNGNPVLLNVTKIIAMEEDSTRGYHLFCDGGRVYEINQDIRTCIEDALDSIGYRIIGPDPESSGQT